MRRPMSATPPGGLPRCSCLARRSMRSTRPSPGRPSHGPRPARNSRRTHNRLAAVGLIEPAHRLTTGDYSANWLAAKRAGGYKPASLIAWGQTVKELTELVGTKPLAGLTHPD